MFSHSRTKNAENNLISIHACNVFTDWKLEQQPSSQHDSFIIDVYTVYEYKIIDKSLKTNLTVCKSYKFLPSCACTCT